VVAIDGPAGAGKSTVARRVAEALDGFRYLDTGAMYRAVTAYLLRIDSKNASEVAMGEAASGLELDGERLRVHGVDVTDDLRRPEVTAEVSRVSAAPPVRRAVQRKQRAQRGHLVAEGRDMGTVVFPDAALKIYLDAKLEVRARRRSLQFPDFTAEEYASRISRRDHHDSSREDSPLRQAEDAIAIDTTNLAIEEVVRRIMALVAERLEQGGDPGSTG
jgi:cytidylate kinase